MQLSWTTLLLYFPHGGNDSWEVLPTKTSVRNLSESGFILEALGKPTLVGGVCHFSCHILHLKRAFNSAILLCYRKEFWQAIFFTLAWNFFFFLLDNSLNIICCCSVKKKRKKGLIVAFPPTKWWIHLRPEHSASFQAVKVMLIFCMLMKKVVLQQHYRRYLSQS